jgi:carbohydrate kinase (thermoresistant glucokinase family)
LACSALKVSYRSILCQACPDLKIILLHGSPEQLTERLQSRKNHFMPPALLASQLATLEIPTNALTLNIALTPEQMIEKIISQE